MLPKAGLQKETLQQECLTCGLHCLLGSHPHGIHEDGISFQLWKVSRSLYCWCGGFTRLYLGVVLLFLMLETNWTPLTCRLMNFHLYVMSLIAQRFSFSWTGNLGFSFLCLQFSSVQFSRSVVSNSSRPHVSQHARPPCPSPSPGVHSNSCPSSR